MQGQGHALCLVAQIGAFGDPGRDPRGWCVSVAYAALVPSSLDVQAAVSTITLLELSRTCKPLSCTWTCHHSHCYPTLSQTSDALQGKMLRICRQLSSIRSCLRFDNRSSECLRLTVLQRFRDVCQIQPLSRPTTMLYQQDLHHALHLFITECPGPPMKS